MRGMLKMKVQKCKMIDDIWLIFFRSGAKVCKSRLWFFLDLGVRIDHVIRSHIVDLVKSFHASIYLQKSALVQPRTGLSKFVKN